MAEKQESPLFRREAMKRISSPEDLTSYLRVTDLGMWIILAAVIVLLAGLFAWAAVGTLETTVNAAAVVDNHTARIAAAGEGADALRAGMPLRIASQEFVIASVEYDEYGRVTAYAEVSLPDGTYEADIVVEETHPVEFLLGSR